MQVGGCVRFWKSQKTWHRLENLRSDSSVSYYAHRDTYWFSFLPRGARSPLHHWWRRRKSGRLCPAAGEWRPRMCWVRLSGAGALCPYRRHQQVRRSPCSRSPHRMEGSSWCWSSHLTRRGISGPSGLGLPLQTGRGSYCQAVAYSPNHTNKYILFFIYLWFGRTTCVKDYICFVLLRPHLTYECFINVLLKRLHKSGKKRKHFYCGFFAEIFKLKKGNFCLPFRDIKLPVKAQPWVKKKGRDGFCGGLMGKNFIFSDIWVHVW